MHKITLAILAILEVSSNVDELSKKDNAKSRKPKEFSPVILKDMIEDVLNRKEKNEYTYV